LIVVTSDGSTAMERNVLSESQNQGSVYLYFCLFMFAPCINSIKNTIYYCNWCTQL